MSQTAHHRVRNTLNSVALLLARLERRVKDDVARTEIKRANEHLKSYVVIHDLLSELEAANNASQDKIDLARALERWSQEQMLGFEVAESSAHESTATWVLVPFASSVLQFLVELRSVALAGGLTLESLQLRVFSATAEMGSSTMQLRLQFKGSWRGGAFTGDLLDAFRGAVATVPLEILSGDRDRFAILVPLQFNSCRF